MNPLARAARPLVVLGDALLDVEITGRVTRVCPDAPVPVVEQLHQSARPGGAALAALLAAAAGDRRVVLVTAIPRDPAGDQLRRLITDAGVELADVGAGGATAEKVRVRCGGQSLLRVDRGGDLTEDVGPVPDAVVDLLGTAGAVLVSDYGRGLTGRPDVREALVQAASDVPVVWDPHPRGSAPVAGCLVATPNLSEAQRLTGTGGAQEERALQDAARAAHRLLEMWATRAVAVTLGARGALLADGSGAPMVVPVPRSGTGDTCGAGDSFAAAAAVVFADGRVLSDAIVGAVEAATRFVLAGGAAGLSSRSTDEEVASPSARPGQPVGAQVEAARRQGHAIVATGGCFDLLHAGHIRLLEQARTLGQFLVVCLNSDASVARLKGAGRPINGEADRRRVLEALGCVDAVAVFDEDTPEALLRALKPDVFVKGGDYAGAALPEERAMAAWGGQVVTLPYLAGRSTTQLLAHAHAHADADPARAAVARATDPLRRTP